VKGTGPDGRILKADIEDYLGELSFLVLQPLNLCLASGPKWCHLVLLFLCLVSQLDLPRTVHFFKWCFPNSCYT
jgi:hypothetical protein